MSNREKNNGGKSGKSNGTKTGRDKTLILLVEDDPGHAILIQKAFQGYSDRFFIQVVTSLGEARRYLQDYEPNLVITDLILPDGRGAELLVGEGEGCPYPLVVMTGFGDEQVAVEMLKAGALDYVVKVESSLREMPRIAERALSRWQDIVERRRMEKALAASEAKFRALVEKAGDIIAILDRDGTYRYLSPPVKEATGFSERELVGKKAADFLHPDDRHIIEELRAKVLEKTRFTISLPHFRFRHKEGPWVILEGVVTNMSEVSGVEGIVVNCRDITEFKRMETSLKRMQKLETIGSLAGRIAHDFNNTLTVILGHISVSKISADHDRRVASLMEAEKGVFKARDMTQQLLFFAEGGSPVKERISVKEIIEEVVESSEGESNIAIQSELQEPLPSIEADAGQIRQVIHNLLLNARQAMPRGGVITVMASDVELETGNTCGLTGGEYVKIEIIDRGIGIAGKYREKIFDPYFSTKSKGRGLGLAMAYSIVVNHKGAMDFYSEPGKGTSFFLYLPTPGEQEEEWEERPEAAAGSGKILIFDDDESIRQVACLLLETLGYAPVVSEDEDGILNMIEKEPFEAVIMELTTDMADDARLLAQRIRQLDRAVKLIVSSGVSNDYVLAKYKDFGFDGVLRKPYRLEEMGETLNKLLAAV